MRFAFIADARSTISQGWIRHFVEHGHDVHVISSYLCSPDVIAGATTHQIPIAFSGFSRVGHNGSVAFGQRASRRTSALANVRVGALSGLSLALRSWLSPLELLRHVKRTRELIIRISPDIVHAMRIPFEGILAAKATPPDIPLVVSVWGNDFTLFAGRNPLIGRQTRQVLQRADALLCDCNRDLRLATRDWGFDTKRLSAVLPSAGGIPTDLCRPAEAVVALRNELGIPAGAPVIFNPRGFRSYVRNDVFFQAIPLVLTENAETVFVCSGMQANPIAEEWIRQMGIAPSVRLLPVVEHQQMFDMFRLAQITVSPSLHDGTPNSLLEAMACGCFPVAGDIESVREWITDGENGLLCDPTCSQSLAHALIRAIQDNKLRERARESNLHLIAERANYGDVMLKAEEFYHRVIQRVSQRSQPALMV